MMKRIGFIILIVFVCFQASSQSKRQIKSFNVTLITSNYDTYGFYKEYKFNDFLYSKDTFSIRYAYAGNDTVFKNAILKKDSAMTFIHRLMSYKNIQNYSNYSKTDSTIPFNTLQIAINGEQKKYSFTIPFYDTCQLKTVTDWLQDYSREKCKTVSKNNFNEYIIVKSKNIETSPLLTELISKFQCNNQKKAIELLKQTNDWNITLGIYKSFCRNVTKTTKDAIAARFDELINDSIKSNAYVDILICQNNDDNIKNLLIKASKHHNKDVSDKASLYLATQGVTDVRPQIIEYIARTVLNNDSRIKPNSYFTITLHICDKDMLKKMIEIYQQNKEKRNPAMKELMHAIECNLNCQRFVHNEYVFSDIDFDFEKVQSRLDAKIEVFNAQNK